MSTSREVLGPQQSQQKFDYWRSLGQTPTRLEILLEAPYNSVMAEVGVQQGEYSQCILDICNPKELHLIDVWETLPPHMVGEGDGSNNFDHNSFYQGVLSKFSSCKNVFIHKELSTKACEKFSDSYFDFVYIDASHKYECVLADLECFWPKVKVGGQLCGDDCAAWEGGFFKEVANAVKDFSTKHNLQPEYLEFAQYRIRRLNGY